MNAEGPPASAGSVSMHHVRMSPLAEAMVIRDATPADAAPIAHLLQEYADRGLLLPRTEAELQQEYVDFGVCERNGIVIGVGALHGYTPALGEIRSVAVRAGCQRHGLGGRLVAWGEARAATRGLQRVFALTYRVRFFERLGYHRLPRARLPEKVWGDCFRCPKAEFCDEVAMAKTLVAQDGGRAPGIML